MPVDDTIKVEINKGLVLRNMGYKDSKNIPDNIMKEIDEIIENSKSLIEPKVLYKEVKFKIKEENKSIIIDNEYVFHGEYLIRNIVNADFLIVAISTIGKGIDEACEKSFSDNDYLKGMAYDAIGAAALDNLNRKFWLKLVDRAKSQGMGITHRLSPGHNDWNIADQKVVFSILDGSEIGVELSKSYMMKPVKSLSIIYGMGKGMPISRVDHDCIDCELENCAFRLMPKADKSHKVKIYNGNRKVTLDVFHNKKLWDILKENNISVQNSCNGHHTCGKCKVVIKPIRDAGLLTQGERDRLTQDELQSGYRLACYVVIDEDMEITVPLVSGDAVVLVDGQDKKVDIEPRVRKVSAKLEEPTINDQRDDLKRLVDSINLERPKISLNALYKLPDTLRNSGFNVSVAIRGNEVLDVDASDNNKVYGIAVDIGTTTVAAYLLNLKNGQQVDVYSALNPQKRYGADVITRINHSISDENGLASLHNLIIDEFNNIIKYFTKRKKIRNEDIYEVTVVGNTTMMHMFAGIPCGYIANAPYIPAYTDVLEIKAKEMRININPEGYIVILPMVSGYVGADTIAAIIASSMPERNEISLLLDIGTNGEIALGNKERIVACSAAAGPAFEGANITFGTGGIKGAISHVNLDSDNIFTTIGGEKPIGLCGSGLVDSIAELIRKGIVDETGRIQKKDELDGLDESILERIVEINGQPAFMLDFETGIAITQKDIRELQLAKGAIAAGVNILIKSMGIQPEDIDKVYFAGGFGNYLSTESAVRIGLVPKVLKNKILQIGNGAGTGAKIALLSDKYLRFANKVKNEVKYIELSSMPDFQTEFMNEMYF